MIVFSAKPSDEFKKYPPFDLGWTPSFLPGYDQLQATVGCSCSWWGGWGVGGGVFSGPGLPQGSAQAGLCGCTSQYRQPACRRL